MFAGQFIIKETAVSQLKIIQWTKFPRVCIHTIFQKIPALFYTAQMPHILLVNCSTQRSSPLSQASLTQFVHGPCTELSNRSTELSSKTQHWRHMISSSRARRLGLFFSSCPYSVNYLFFFQNLQDSENHIKCVPWLMKGTTHNPNRLICSNSSSET